MSAERPPEAPAGRETTLHRSRLTWLVTVACALTMLGLVVTIAHFLRPTPLMFALFMSAGQGSFGLAMILYLVAILADLRRRKVL